MGKMLTVEVDDSFAKTIDNVVLSTKLYSSRSEFLKDSIRKNLAEILKFNEDLKKIHVQTQKLALKAKKRGFNGKLPVLEERQKLARDFLKEKGI